MTANGARRDVAADATGTFQVDNPAKREPLPEQYPISSWRDCDAALSAAAAAYLQLRTLPAEQIAKFIERFADRVTDSAPAICQRAHLESGYPIAPRLAEVEMPRTINQVRLAAAAVREGSWALPTIDTKANLRSCLGPIGPVCVFGPNNFPLAYGSASGGDFASAIAAGNPVIAKASTSSPGTSKLFAEQAHAAALETGLPSGTIQLLYRTGHAEGEKLISDHRVAATGYTGSRPAGLKLKAAADAAGKLIYLELSSINPVVILPGALKERAGDVASQFLQSCLMAMGQFCTNPGLVLLMASAETEAFIADLVKRFAAAPVGTLLSQAVEKSLSASVTALQKAGAELLVGGTVGGGTGYSYPNTLLRTSGAKFLANPAALQTEAFGNSSLLVVGKNLDEVLAVIDALEGNLTGSIYSDQQGSDDETYRRIEPHLRQQVGRLLNDAMPTGVAVSAAMNHGGPYPATSHPGFTAVGVPASLRRFAALHSYDRVRPGRLPPLLSDKNLTPGTWRLVDGRWTQADVPAINS